MPLFEGNEEVAHNKELASKKFFVYNLEHCNSIFILQIRTMTYEKKWWWIMYMSLVKCHNAW